MTDIPILDEIELCKGLVAQKTVTPDARAAFDYLEPILQSYGFICHRMIFTDADTPAVENMFAYLSAGDMPQSPHISFAGHVDVVPEGAFELWSSPPFEPTEKDGKLIGRGTSDMKGAIACFIAAAMAHGRPKKGTISLLLTGDEEGPAINGTVKVLQWLSDKGWMMDHCIVGEPTNPDILGEMMKIGRRGSLTAELKIHGKQGHVAYPHLADNPLHKASAIMAALLAEKLDNGNEYFPPSSLQIVAVETDNKADNVIPAHCLIRLNIRFNDFHNSTSLEKWIGDKIAPLAQDVECHFFSNAESFISPPDNALIPILQQSIQQVTGRRAAATTTGGTSDARFISRYAPTVEFGLINKTIHQIDEYANLSDVRDLKKIYLGALQRYFDQV